MPQEPAGLLESGTYRRVGSTELRRADVRVIAISERSLYRKLHALASR